MYNKVSMLGRFYGNQSGQALVIVLLVVSVILTVSLSVISRSITDITVSEKEEDALRAFSAAESGIEKALIANTGSVGSLPSGASFNAQITGLATGTTEFNIPIRVRSGESVNSWFMSHDVSNMLVCGESDPCFIGRDFKVCWGDAGTPGNTPDTPALEMSILYLTTPNDFSSVRIARGVYDPNSARVTSDGSNFSAANGGSCTVDGKQYAFSTSVNLSSLGVTTRPNPSDTRGPIAARLKLIYNSQDQPVGVVVGGGVLPNQGTKVDSVGVSGLSNRRIIVNRIYPDLPPIFDFALFSGSGDLVK